MIIKLLIKRYLYKRRVKKHICTQFTSAPDSTTLSVVTWGMLIFILIMWIFTPHELVPLALSTLWVLPLLFFEYYTKRKKLLKNISYQSYHIHKLFKETKINEPFKIELGRIDFPKIRWRLIDYEFYFNKRYIKYNKSFKKRILQLPRPYQGFGSFFYRGKYVALNRDEVLDRELPNNKYSYYFEILGPLKINYPVPSSGLVADHNSDVRAKKSFKKINQVLVAKISKKPKSEGDNDDYEGKLVLISRFELGLFDIVKN